MICQQTFNCLLYYWCPNFNMFACNAAGGLPLRLVYQRLTFSSLWTSILTHETRLFLDKMVSQLLCVEIEALRVRGPTRFQQWKLCTKLIQMGVVKGKQDFSVAAGSHPFGDTIGAHNFIGMSKTASETLLVGTPNLQSQFGRSPTLR